MKTKTEIEKMIRKAVSPKGSGLEGNCFGSTFDDGVISALRWVLRLSKEEKEKAAKESLSRIQSPEEPT